VFVPGPEFIWAPAEGAARARHAITRMRLPKPWWQARRGEIAFLFAGVLLGMLLWWAIQLLLRTTGWLS